MFMGSSLLQLFKLQISCLFQARSSLTLQIKILFPFLEIHKVEILLKDTGLLDLNVHISRTGNAREINGAILKSFY